MLVPCGTAGRAVDKALTEGVLLASEETLTELAEVLLGSSFRQRHGLHILSPADYLALP